MHDSADDDCCFGPSGSPKYPPCADCPLRQPVATVVDGCAVHGDEPLTPDGTEAVRQVIAAVRERIANG